MYYSNSDKNSRGKTRQAMDRFVPSGKETVPDFELLKSKLGEPMYELGAL